MSEKSHVGMGFSVCPVCGTKHSEVILLDRRLRETLERDNFMGYELCPEHAKLQAEGYIALVVVTNTEQPTLKTAERTGEVMHIRDTAWPRVFNMPIPKQGLTFIDVEGAAKLQEMARPDYGHAAGGKGE